MYRKIIFVKAVQPKVNQVQISGLTFNILFLCADCGITPESNCKKKKKKKKKKKTFRISEYSFAGMNIFVKIRPPFL